MWTVLWDSPIYLYILYLLTLLWLIAVMLDIVCNSPAFLCLFSWLPHIFLKGDVWQVSLLIDNSLCLNKSAIFKKSLHAFWLTCHHSWVKKEDFQAMIAVCRSTVCYVPPPTATLCFLSSRSWRCIRWGCFHININEMPKIFNAWTSMVHVWSASLLCCVFFLKSYYCRVWLFHTSA